MGPPQIEKEGDTLGTCDSHAVRFNQVVDNGSLQGEALLLPSAEGRELGMTDGSDDSVSEMILDVRSIDGKQLGLSLKEEVGDALRTCDSPTVGFIDSAEGGLLLGEELLLPSKTAGGWESSTAPLTANLKRSYSIWDHLRAQRWDVH